MYNCSSSLRFKSVGSFVTKVANVSTKMLYLILAFFLSTIVAVAVYCKLTIGWCRSQTCLIGKTAIVTGANSGIGFETALDFAKRGARVILACRDKTRAEDARERIINATDNKNVIIELIDMSSFDSVRAFAKKINQSEERLDILVNNAGAGEPSDRRTKDGHLPTMQINYFSAFLLTNLLIGLMKKTGKSRIVNVSSVLAGYGYDFNIDKIDDIPDIWFNEWFRFNDWFVYIYSKLSFVLFTIELARRLENTEITAYSLHPGVVSTDIFKHLNGFQAFIINLGKILFFKSSEEGAQTTIYCSVQKGIEQFSGDFFLDCRRRKRYNTATVSNKTLTKLWEKTKDIVQLRPEESHL